MATIVTALETVHELQNFDCDNEDLNQYLRTTAGQHQKKFISKTYVMVDEEKPQDVLGFYTLAIRKMIPIEDLPAPMAKKLPREVAGFTLARLAIDKNVKKKGHGEYLLLHAMSRAFRVANEVGAYALFVDAKDSEAASFYRKYGFTPFPDNPLILCMPFAAMPRF